MIQCFYSVWLFCDSDFFPPILFPYPPFSFPSSAPSFLPSLPSSLPSSLPLASFVFPSLPFKNPHLLLYFSFEPHLSVSPMSPEFRRALRESASQAISVHSQSLKRDTNTLWKRGLSILCSTTRKTNCTRAILLSTLASTSPTSMLFNFSFERCDRATPQCLKEIFLFFLYPVWNPSLYLTSPPPPRDPSSHPPRPPPKISESVCLLLVIKQQIPAF